MKFITARNTLLAMVLFTFFIAGLGVWQVQTNPQSERPQTQRIDETSYTEEQKKQQIPVTIGVYPLTVYRIDTVANTYQMTAYVWMKWKGDITPDKSLEIMNTVDSSGLLQTLIYSGTLEDGSTYTVSKIDGTFFQSFDMAKFPVDTQKLSLIFEDSEYFSDEMRYVADVKQSNAERLKIPGWDIKNLKFIETEAVYNTNFGVGDDVPNSVVPQLEFSIVIQRPIMTYLIKFLFPLTLILLTYYIVFWLPYVMVESKIYFITGTLLTVMFFQQVFMGKTDIQQLVLIDYIFLFTYLSTVLSLIIKIYFYYKIQAGWEEERAVAWDRAIFSVHYMAYVLLTFWVFMQYYSLT
jgi:hypothetical protein